MDFLGRMTEVINYIEDHISDDIDFSSVSKIVCCGVYQFGRIFSYVVGMPLSEYVRRRRLSLAALELQTGNNKVIDVALKYGYNSPEAFSRAFRDMHGIAPKEACTLGVKLRLYPRITFHISIKGDADMEYRIEEKNEITVVGVVRNLGRWTLSTDEKKSNLTRIREIWDEYLGGGMNEVIGSKYELYRPPFWQIGVTHTKDNGETILAIGAESDGNQYKELDTYIIPASIWAVFTGKGAVNNPDHPLHGSLMTRIMSEWLPSSGYEKSMNCEIEIYGPGDAFEDSYTCEIWIPVKKK
ncbi:MAG: AraC family transcriptional regulator [Clostridia bacterium]|nr:AraC family transcriptional regulator [Clostridia bacterium]